MCFSIDYEPTEEKTISQFKLIKLLETDCHLYFSFMEVSENREISHEYLSEWKNHSRKNNLINCHCTSLI